MKKLLSLVLVLFAFTLKPALANYFIDGRGQIYYLETGAVLGITANPSAANSRSAISPLAKPTPAPTSTSLPTIKSQKIEVRSVNDQIKFRFVDKNNIPITSDESTPSSEITIDKAADTDTVTLTSSKSASQIIRNKIAAQTHFPLMVNLETNELIVTTPKGEKVVTILPDQAVAHMLAANVLDQAGGKGGLLWLASLPTPTLIVTPTATAEATLTPIETPTATPEASLTPEEPSPTEIPPEATPTPTGSSALSAEQISLTETPDGVLAYEIPGTKTKKLFGFYKITLQRTAVVSAETGELLSIQQTTGARILDLLSR